jgi:hypothetical protein
MKKSKAKERMVIQLDPGQRKILDRIKEETGASFAEIIRRLITKEGAK